MTVILDKIVTQVYDVALGEVKHYVGNYERFIEQRDQYYQNVCKNIKSNKMK